MMFIILSNATVGYKRILIKQQMIVERFPSKIIFWENSGKFSKLNICDLMTNKQMKEISTQCT